MSNCDWIGRIAQMNLPPNADLWVAETQDGRLHWATSPQALPPYRKDLGRVWTDAKCQIVEVGFAV